MSTERGKSKKKNTKNYIKQIWVGFPTLHTISHNKTPWLKTHADTHIHNSYIIYIKHKHRPDTHKQANNKNINKQAKSNRNLVWEKDLRGGGARFSALFEFLHENFAQNDVVSILNVISVVRFVIVVVVVAIKNQNETKQNQAVKRLW